MFSIFNLNVHILVCFVQFFSPETYHSLERIDFSYMFTFIYKI